MHAEGMDTCRSSILLGVGDLQARVKVAFVGAVCGAWTRRTDAVDMAAACLRLAEELGDPRSLGWAELAVAVVSGNDGLPRGSGVSVPDAVTSAPMQRAVDAWATAPGPAWWDPVWERGLQQLCRSIFLPYGPERFGEFLDSQAAFQAVGDRGWLAILYAQCLELVEFAGADTTRRLLEDGAQISLSPNWSTACRYRLGVLEQVLGDHDAAIRHLSRAIDHRRATADSSYGAELRFLAISQSETEHLDVGAELVLAAFALAGSDHSEREVQRTLAAAAYVLEAAGQLELAAAAAGRAAPYQDNYVDTLGTVRSRLRVDLGDERTHELMNAGDQRDLLDLVREVRSTLAGITSEPVGPI
jgi:tetratricopeptide (TPR) repeat protein